VSPDLTSFNASRSSWRVRVGLPFTATMMSGPPSSSAESRRRYAGPSGDTTLTISPPPSRMTGRRRGSRASSWVSGWTEMPSTSSLAPGSPPRRPRVFEATRASSSAGALHVAALDQLLHHRAREVNGNGEAVARVEPGLARDRRVDADHLAMHVHERSPRVARVDGRVGLDEVLNGVARLLQAAQQPSLGAHDPRGDREGEVLPERIPDREHPLPDADGIGVPELRGGQAVRVDLDDGDVGAGVGSHDARRELPLVEELYRDAIGARNHVVVGQDVAVRGDDEARARALLDLRPAPELRKEVVEPRR